MPHLTARPPVPLNQGLLQQGLSQAQPPPLPGGFAPGQVGQFSGGGFVDVDLSPQARSKKGRKGKRARRIFANRVKSGQTLAEAAGIQVTPQLQSGIEQLVQSGANRTAIAGLIDVVQERQEAAAQQQRGVEQAITSIQGATGVSRQGIQLGRGIDPQLEPLIQGIAQGDPAALQALQGLEQQSPRAEQARGNALDLLEAQLLTAQREGTNKLLTRERNFRKEFKDSIGLGVEIVTTTQQLEELLASDTPLAALSTVIKLARLLDPESVVREGEVTTVQGGTGTAAALVTSMNKYINKGLGEDARREFQGVINALAIPEAKRAQRIITEFTGLADRAGIDVSVGLAGTGIDRDFLDRLASGSVFGTDFNDL